jgi:hypothetical protein
MEQPARRPLLGPRQQGLSVAKEAAKDNRFLSSLHDFFTIESIPLISNEP